MRNALSIVHVARSPVGGVFRHIADLARAQHAAGHSVGLICDNADAGPLVDERIAALSSVLSLGVTRLPMARSIGPGDFPATLAVARAVAKVAPDVIHAHGAKGGVYGRLAAALERRRQRAPVAAFYAPHGGSLHYETGSVAGIAYFAIERALEGLTDGLIHVSDFEAETYRKKVGVPRCAAHVVRNGLAPDEFDPVEPNADAADFLFIGELRDLKGVDVFIEALARIERAGRATRALIVGPSAPGDLARYKALAAARLRTTSLDFRLAMPARQAFALARTIVLPSRAESLPYMVLEVAAAALPLIVTNVGGIPEIFEGETERLVAPGDAEALAEAMRAALALPERLAAEAVLRRERVRQKFSLAVTSQRIEDIYRGALEARYRLKATGPAAELDATR